MGRKAKYSPEVKVQACEDYLSGRKSAIRIARELDMGKRGKDEVFVWSKRYKTHGASVFKETHTNRSYSREFKEKAVRDYLEGKASLGDLAVRYGVPSVETVRQWVSRYNSHIENRDYDPKPEVYMAESRKTSYDERLEIVKYCLDHERRIADTAAFYRCSYAQVYSWIRNVRRSSKKNSVSR